MNYPLQDKTAVDTTVVFEDKTQRTNATPAQVKAQTLTVEFNFNDVTEGEILQFLVSSTSCMKMFQNNVTKNWTNAITQEEVQKGTYKVSVREMLDGRVRASLTPEKSAERAIEGMVKKGLTLKQIQDKINSMMQ